MGGSMSQAPVSRLHGFVAHESRIVRRSWFAGPTAARTVLLSAVATLLVSPATLAQIEEITVVARKKEERLTDVPLAIEAISGEEIARKGLTNISKLAEQSASIKFDQGSSRQDTRLSIRGISPSRGRQNAAILVDGIDISSEAVTTSGGGFLLNQNLLSLQRVEFLKGPQIALWGRSAFNGAVNFVTKDPPLEWESTVSADANAEDQYQAGLEFGGPVLDDRLGVIFNAAWWDRDGFYDNSITGQNLGREEGFGMSLKTKSSFDNGLTISTRIYYEDYEAGQSPEAFIPFNTLVQQPAEAFQINNDPRLNPNPTPPQANAALYCLFDLLPPDDPNNPNEVRDRLVNQALIDRYAASSRDPSNPIVGDGPHCQRSIPFVTGRVPDGDQLKAMLAPNPFDPGNDFPGIDGDTLRLSVVAKWQLDKGSLNSWTGYTHDDNNEQVDFSRFAIYNPDNPFLDDNVNSFISNNDRKTEQWQQELRYVTEFDGPVNVAIGGNYWKEKVENDSLSLTMQAGNSTCFYSSNVPGNADQASFVTFTGNPCPGYTSVPIQAFVGGGQFTFGNGEPYEGIGEYLRSYEIGRDTDHRSIYGNIDIKMTERLSLSLEGRWSYETLDVTGPVFLNPAASSPGSWSVCGLPFNACTEEFLFHAPGFYGGDPRDLGGPFWSRENFQLPSSRRSEAAGGQNVGKSTGYDVWDPIEFPSLLEVIPDVCLQDPGVQARIEKVQTTGEDDFDLFHPYCTGKLQRTDQWFSPKATLSFKPTDRSMLYTYWARSEKPGGFALFTVGSAGLREDLAAFDPEVMETYEIGGNVTLLDNTLFLSGAVFYNDYTDKQVLVQGLGADGRSVSRIDNAPAELLGAEIAAQWRPFETFLGGNWNFTAAYTYIDGEYKDFVDNATSENNIASAGNCIPTVLTDSRTDPVTGELVTQARAACQISFDGNKFERAPEHSFVGSIGYIRPVSDELELFTEVGAQWKDKQFVEYTNENYLAAYWNVDFQLGVRASRWEVLGYVQNVFDDDSIRVATNQPALGCCFMVGVSVDVGGNNSGYGSGVDLPLAKAAVLPPPRVLGLRANYRFGGD